MEIPVEKIKCKNRVRKDLGDLEPLKNSIRQHGLFHPVIVDQHYNLISGQRRLQAVKELAYETLEVKVVNIDSPVKKLILELEENSCRKDFSTEEWLKGKKMLVEIGRRGFFWRIYYFFVNLFRKIFGA